MLREQDKKQHNITKLIEQFNSMKISLCFKGIFIGVISGIIVILYRLILEYAEELRHFASDAISKSPALIIVWFIVLIILAIIVSLLLKKDPFISGSGIPQVEASLSNRIRQNWLSVLLRKFIGGVLCLIAGLSVGREGPSIQLGAVAAQGTSEIFKRSKTEEKYLVTAGACAGLAAAFNAPLAGVMFALEEVHKHFSPLVLIAAMSSSIAADFISKHVFGLEPVFQFGAVTPVPLNSYGYLILLGIIVGLFGVLYNKTVTFSFNMYEKLTFLKVHQRPIIPFLLSGILLVTFPAVLGGGHHLVDDLTAGNFSLYFIFFLLILKFIFSMISFASGVPGGIFFPLLVIGALTGGLFGETVITFFGVDPSLFTSFIILAMAGYFTAIVRAPITGAILITEMTGSFSNLLPLSVVALIAYTVAELFASEPVYEILLHRLLKTQPKRSDSPLESDESHLHEKVIIEVPIFSDSEMDGKLVRDLSLPENSLLIGVRRGKEELIPRGNTRVLAGDFLVVLFNANVEETVHDQLVGCSTLIKI